MTSEQILRKLLDYWNMKYTDATMYKWIDGVSNVPIKALNVGGDLYDVNKLDLAIHLIQRTTPSRKFAFGIAHIWRDYYDSFADCLYIDPSGHDTRGVDKDVFFFNRVLSIFQYVMVNLQEDWWIKVHRREDTAIVEVGYKDTLKKSLTLWRDKFLRDGVGIRELIDMLNYIWYYVIIDNYKGNDEIYKWTYNLLGTQFWFTHGFRAPFNKRDAYQENEGIVIPPLNM